MHSSSSSHPGNQIPAFCEPRNNNGEPIESHDDTFWTVCPYCYYLYQFYGIYEDYFLMCQNCTKPFHGVPVRMLWPGILFQGKDRYHCGVGYFSVKYYLGDNNGGNSGIKEDDDFGIVGKEVFKNKRNCNEDGTEAAPQSSEGKDGKVKRKRKIHCKTVAKKKQRKGRGIRYKGLDLSGNTDAELKNDDQESQPEYSGRNGSQEEGSCEDDLEFFIGEDDIYVGLKSR